MRNIDKYEKEIKKIIDGGSRVAIYTGNNKISSCCSILCENCKFWGKHYSCEIEFAKWLFEEYEVPILDEAEKSYLEYVLRPLKNQVKTIRKNHVQSRNNNYKSIEYIRVLLSSPLTINGEETLIFPGFIANTMYKGMDVSKEYTLKELGLFEGE